eukprot:139219-Chlamydomonas_euryale.AAC.1
MHPHTRPHALACAAPSTCELVSAAQLSWICAVVRVPNLSTTVILFWATCSRSGYIRLYPATETKSPSGRPVVGSWIADVRNVTNAP